MLKAVLTSGACESGLLFCTQITLILDRMFTIIIMIVNISLAITIFMFTIAALN